MGIKLNFFLFTYAVGLIESYPCSCLQLFYFCPTNKEEFSHG